LERHSYSDVVVSVLLSVTFACGVVIAVAHVFNRGFIAPIYDVVANLTAFGCAVAASSMLGHPAPAALSGIAILCWLVLASYCSRVPGPTAGCRDRLHGALERGCRHGRLVFVG
jgi:hypothetical protein